MPLPEEGAGPLSLGKEQRSSNTAEKEPTDRSRYRGPFQRTIKVCVCNYV